ncbi:aldolase/citrate lyase family protein [Photobacterium sp. 2_MG-2023]|uniref:aldolase/citrate lyase family protein n=1 Tax=Photobacterium sp. 2_MG-2023 TaxID=3062663 RepID=UPI0026E3EB5F|nr:aldolase/citrate lyase family protein [Photobacterium sp. 2_MG-2023]MDO6579742.1 aldolase/citrate lyase family protein [Photobacterium sp. 2_MG-2023]
MKKFKYMFITNKPDLAKYAEASGVDRIFVDLEILGKEERQGHLNTVISRHSLDDVLKVKKILSQSELLVRINPFNENSRTEVESVISAGADIVMLPMIKSIDEVISIGEYINSRAKLIPLIETSYSAENIFKISELHCVDELHIGLNDLHLELNLSFMFELLSNGYVEKMVNGLKKPFGIGGIARVGVGNIGGETVITEHVRLGSTRAILSRAFHMEAKTVDELKRHFSLSEEIKKIDDARNNALNLSTQAMAMQHYHFSKSVEEIVRKINETSI